MWRCPTCRTSLKPVAEALYAAHERTILHRNIKPTKVLVRHSDGTWQIRLIDFCLAPKRPVLLGSLNSGPYWSKSVVGTSAIGALPYVPPEELGLLEGVRLGPGSDLYSLGKTCYFAVLGTPEPDDEEKDTLPLPWRQAAEPVRVAEHRPATAEHGHAAEAAGGGAGDHAGPSPPSGRRRPWHRPSPPPRRPPTRSRT